MSDRISQRPRFRVPVSTLLLTLLLLWGSTACDEFTSPTEPGGPEGAENSEGGEGSEGSEGHGAEGSEGSGGEAGESGTRYGIDETFDEIQSGVRLILRYNRGSGFFEGTFENTTSGRLARVRVEVHLSSGVELGPTPSIPLAAGEIREVTLSALGETFTWYTAHPEVG